MMPGIFSHGKSTLLVFFCPYKNTGDGGNLSGVFPIPCSRELCILLPSSRQ